MTPIWLTLAVTVLICVCAVVCTNWYWRKIGFHGYARWLKDKLPYTIDE